MSLKLPFTIVKKEYVERADRHGRVVTRMQDLYWLSDYKWIVNPIVDYLHGKIHAPDHLRVHIDSVHSKMLDEKQQRIRHLEAENWKLNYQNQQLLSAINIKGSIEGYQVIPMEIDEEEE